MNRVYTVYHLDTEMLHGDGAVSLFDSNFESKLIIIHLFMLLNALKIPFRVCSIVICCSKGIQKI